MTLLRQIQRPAFDCLPLAPMLALQEELARWMDDRFTGCAGSQELAVEWTPPMDFLEDKDRFQVRLELPGLKKEDVSIALQDNALTISGERKQTDHTDAKSNNCTERLYGRFTRTVALPKPVSADQVSAQFKDGLLTVTLPKSDEAKPRQITVEQG